MKDLLDDLKSLLLGLAIMGSIGGILWLMILFPVIFIVTYIAFLSLVGLCVCYLLGRTIRTELKYK